jgi:predicted DNA-binding protein with PD1-like motif
MKSQRLDNGTVLIFETGDEVVSTLTAFAKEHHIAAAHFHRDWGVQRRRTWIF